MREERVDRLDYGVRDPGGLPTGHNKGLSSMNAEAGKIENIFGKLERKRQKSEKSEEKREAGADREFGDRIGRGEANWECLLF